MKEVTKVTKEQIKLVDTLLRLFLIGLGLFIWYTYFRSIWYLFFIVIIFGATLPTILLSLVGSSPPNSRPNKKETLSTKGSKIPQNRLIGDNEILKTDLEKLSGIEFERLCYMYLTTKFKEVEETPAIKDKGVDLKFKDKDGFWVAVQCKHFSKGIVSSKDLNALEGAKRSYKCSRTLFITSSYFSKPATDYANEVGMDFWNKNLVEKNIIRWKNKRAKELGLIK